MLKMVLPLLHLSIWEQEHLLNRIFSRYLNADKKRLSKYVLCFGDIVFSRVGSVDRCSFVDQAHDGCFLDGVCVFALIRQLTLCICTTFSAWKKQSSLYVILLLERLCHLYNTKLLGEIAVVYPDMATQKKISGTLSAIDSKIELNKKINDNLEQQAQAFFQEMFVDNTTPEWTIGTISDFGTVVGGSTPSKSKPEYYTETGIAWITPKDLSINKSKFISHGESDITELGLKNSSATIMFVFIFPSRKSSTYVFCKRISPAYFSFEEFMDWLVKA